MGVPALFRWLSKKYPKIISSVVEEEEIKVAAEDDELVTIPVNMSHPNPNGTEFDNLYLDMNGIVHPCTHPEGKPAPETEEEMMSEIFQYTERVVNMVRPRKLLFMAIDGVAPRAKMNQQRSRRFRSAQEASDKEEARKESVALWEAMGKELSEEEKNKVSWDSNAITPGTPFMDLLASSLRYWVVQKMNTDPGWKNMQVIISDASVPGEGEHKIMDFIRRQRSNPGHDPNSQHVIYGLDADLIMLALATHEPYFRVLREDVFNEGSSTACRMCGQEGHYAAQCTGTKADIAKKPPAEKKPFIFLDVAILREYLEVELEVTQAPFPFNLEQAIDDWVLLIFFVGNDFLPHLPSLEIREGAVDTLLKIWKQELPRMGGYLTNHGELERARAQIILEGVAKREDDIFRRRREAEERQDQNAKRRKIEAQRLKDGQITGPSPTLGLTAPPTAPSTTTSHSNNSAHPSLPQRPDFAANADSMGLGAAPTAESIQNIPTAAQALAGSNRDVVANRRAIRMANLSAAEVLKAELSGLVPVKPDLSLPAKPSVNTDVVPPATLEPLRMSNDPPPRETSNSDDIPGFGAHNGGSVIAVPSQEPASEPIAVDADVDADAEGEPDLEDKIAVDGEPADTEPASTEDSLSGKRKFEEGPGEDEADETLADDEEAPADGAVTYALKVNADGTVDQPDTVKLWEPGYRERYYRQKFGVELGDTEFKTALVQSYVEGMAWVLHYYYQGTPSWHWYYPYHFAPFAADFVEIDKLDIKFEPGMPFKPYEQLMGVFPAASRQHIPSVFHHLMTDEESPIIDFYPQTFQIDMNGKRMAWQGVALLPFINEERLLEAMKEPYTKLSEEEIRRNAWGNNVIFASDEHPIYPFYEQLYGKVKKQDPIPIDASLSKGISGSVLPNPDCLPGSTYYCPLSTQNLPDIKNDKSLSVLYYFPKQLRPHRSILLPGARRPPRVLSANDLEVTRSGGRGRGRGGWDRGGGGGRGGGGYNNGNDRGGRSNDPFHSNSRSSNYGQQSWGNDRGNSSRGGNSYQQPSYPSRTNYQSQPPPQQHSGYGGYVGYGGGGGGGYGGNRGGGAAPGRGAYNSYGGYDGQSGGGGGGQQGYGGYGNGGGGGAGAGGGYGGYGGYGGGQNTNNGYGYTNGGRGGAPYNTPPRGRGRGW